MKRSPSGGFPKTWDRAFSQTPRLVVPPEGALSLEEVDGETVLCRPEDWALGGEGSVLGFRTRQDTEDVLPQFVRIAEKGTPEAVLRFARRWGILDLCDHGNPAAHAPGCEPTGREPIETWLRFSEQARSLIEIADHLHRKELPDADLWKAVYRRRERDAPWWSRDVAGERMQLAMVLQEWLHLGGVAPSVQWADMGKGDGLRVGLQREGLFGVLATELVFTAAKTDGLAWCDGCKGFYVPRRKPRKDRNNYCDRCREEGVPARMRKRRQRAREN